MNTVLPALGVSILSGLYTSAWGAFKDAPYEGFNRRSFPRSIFFSIAIALVLAQGPLPAALHERFAELSPFLIFFLVMGAERIITEIYKACFRDGDQSKFFIPQRLTFFGRHVRSDVTRWAAG